MDMNIIFGLDGDETVPVVSVVPVRVTPARAVAGTVEAGQRCFVFQNFVWDPNAGVDVTNWGAAMTVSEDETENQLAINAQLANPPYSAITLL
jgi:hypothetical protein